MRDDADGGLHHWRRDTRDGELRGGYSRSSETDIAIEHLEQTLEEARGKSEHPAIKKSIGLLRNA